MKIGKEPTLKYKKPYKTFTTYFKFMTFSGLEPCILSYLSPTPSLDPITSLQSTLCHQPHTIHTQYVTTIYKIFPKPKVVST